MWVNSWFEITESLSKHACKTICDVNWGIDPNASADSIMCQIMLVLYVLKPSKCPMLETKSKRFWNVGKKYYICWKHKFGFKRHFTKCKLGC